MQPTMIDGKTLAIGVLSVTACVLFVGFLVLTTLSTPAQGLGMNDRGGDYILLTQKLSSSQEGIIVADAAAKRIVLYGYDFSRKQLIPLSGYSLDQLPSPAEGGQRGGRRP